MEVFVTATSVPLMSPLQAQGMIEASQVSTADIPRRARTYLRGYYKTLRLAALTGFNHTDTLQLLQEAETLIPTISPDKATQVRCKKTVSYDRDQINKPMMMESCKTFTAVGLTARFFKYFRKTKSSR
jgi:hypothetical protein